ncbi:hypothetical protein C8R41DRAFT_461485 [Lentinula lateritia]|uniref:Uncharacterized protein n=1 Tax=Lentinula lateritia TaxID=40482 RepID=A0ABQ8VAU1_9AGAR|nr:hypothetical protein C8R41DRAFT_461485 [Lentinula lateritia]
MGRDQKIPLRQVLYIVNGTLNIPSTPIFLNTIMKFIVSISTFLLVTLLAITVDAIALDDKLACGAPWNIGHSEGSSCKFWGKDGNGTHVHDGTCHKRSGFHVIHRYECITTSVDLQTTCC